MVQRNDDGTFKAVVTYAIIRAPAQLIWETILDINSYTKYMPRLVEANLLEDRSSENEIYASFEIEVPMKNTRYTLKHVLNSENNTITIYPVSGDLEGSRWQWKLYPQGNSTLVVYTGRTVNYSAFLQTFEDRQQTITVGINISSNMTTIQSIKDRAEYLFMKEKK